MTEVTSQDRPKQEPLDSALPTMDDQAISEMIELGFWPADDKDILAATLQQTSLMRSVSPVTTDPEPVSDKNTKKRSNKQKQRLEKQKQQRKLQRLQQAYDNARAWHEFKTRKIIYLGEQVSAGLLDNKTDYVKLQANNLPVVDSPEQLAEAMGVSLAELRFLSYSKKTSKIRHYRQFTVVKKSGGVRRLSAPMPRLKRLQYWILDNILEVQEPHHTAHGFVPDRSIVSNAELHVMSSLVVNIDLENFFPTIHYKRVKGLFRSFGYSDQVATLLALLCTEFDFDQVRANGELFFVGNGERKLPQGAPTSPAISNLICRTLDRRLEAMAAKMEYTYTRYADDITFSSRSNPARHVQKLMWRARQIVKDEGFRINKNKTKIMRPHRQQHVTGLVVNQKLSIPRKTVMRFRALLHQMEQSGLENRIWNGLSGTPMIKAVMGFAHYVKMIEPAKGEKFLRQLYRIREKYLSEWPKTQGQKRDSREFRRKAAAGEAPRADWWVATPRPFEFATPVTAGEQQPVLKIRQREVPQRELQRDEPVDDSFDIVVREQLQQYANKAAGIEPAPTRKFLGLKLGLGLAALVALSAAVFIIFFS